MVIYSEVQSFNVPTKSFGTTRRDIQNAKPIWGIIIQSLSTESQLPPIYVSFEEMYDFINIFNTF